MNLGYIPHFEVIRRTDTFQKYEREIAFWSMLATGAVVLFAIGYGVRALK